MTALRSVLITGCSTGIGRASAIDLATTGWQVFAGVRRHADAADLERVLTEQNNVRGSLKPVLLDITRVDDVERAITELTRVLGDSGLDALVNNAGILTPGPLELITLAELRHQFEVNVFGTHAITQAALPLLRSASLPQSRRIVLVGSISGRITPPFYGAYAASKHALEAMADAWRVELQEWGIRVSIIQPDSVVTPLWDKSTAALAENAVGTDPTVAEAYRRQLRTARRGLLKNHRTGMRSEHVVNAIRESLQAKNPRAHYPVGWRTRAAFFANSCLPASWMDYILRRAVGG